ncbi:MAG: TIGR00282 family metallophosphoesterase [Miltoncostaeaceae bacterium]
MRILMVGDVVGGVGLRAVVERLPGLREQHQADLVVVNAENAARGAGTSPRQARDLLEAGADVLTGGNHTLRRTELYPVLNTDPRVLRPENLAVRAPGGGLAVVDTPVGAAAVINVVGSVFMDSSRSAFATADELVERVADGARFIVVDMHAEATSEKVALARHLAGRVTAVVGTHTHVQTADAQIIPPGTAYVTDLGMSGPHDSVIGVRTETIITRFLTGAPGSVEPAEGGVKVQGAIIEADPDGRATSVATFSIDDDGSAWG